MLNPQTTADKIKNLIFIGRTFFRIRLNARAVFVLCSMAAMLALALFQCKKKI